MLGVGIASAVCLTRVQRACRPARLYTVVFAPRGRFCLRHRAARSCRSGISFWAAADYRAPHVSPCRRSRPRRECCCSCQCRCCLACRSRPSRSDRNSPGKRGGAIRPSAGRSDVRGWTHRYTKRKIRATAGHPGSLGGAQFASPGCTTRCRPKRTSGASRLALAATSSGNGLPHAGSAGTRVSI